VSTNIEPNVTIIPREYDGGGYGTMFITVINGNPTSSANLINDDWFEFALDRPWGASAKLATKNVIVNFPAPTVRFDF
jgi:hypothetical protein